MKQAVIDKKMAVKIRMVVQLTPQERTDGQLSSGASVGCFMLGD